MSKLVQYLTGGEDIGPCWIVETDELHAMRRRVHEAVTGGPMPVGRDIFSLCREDGDCVRPDHSRVMSAAETFHRGMQLGRELS